MQTVNYTIVGKKIKENRLKLKITQEQLAEKCDVSVSYIAHIERGTKSLSLETAVKVSNALNVSLDYLLIDEIHNNDRIIEAIEAELSKCTPTQIDKFIRIARVLIKNIDEI
ncbi:MAG: helix-turn-helix domain-containing protein [Ruminococcus sp.]